ncbi:MAG: hypothetical protein K0B02_04525 [DPANN group archaeon]|nr:hypothetical protein [DPANN group archaeon]
MSEDTGIDDDVDDVLLIYGIISEIMKDDTSEVSLSSVKSILRQSTGVLLDNDTLDEHIKSFVDEGIFDKNGDQLILGLESDYFF